jgi:hypothetical protein
MVPLYGPLIGQGKLLMRTAFATVILAAVAATAAQAQTAPAAAPPAATTAAPPAAAPSTTAPAAPAATPPAQADQAAAAPPTLPTTGPGAVLLNVVEKVCVPLVRGGNLDQLMPQIQGAKKNRRDGFWTVQLGGASKDYLVNIFPVGINKDVCRGEVHYGFDDEKAIVSAFNIWSFLHQPELILQANYVSVNADGIKRVQKSWEHLDSASSTAVNFTTWTKPDDTPLAKGYATGEVFYQERKLTQ